MEATLKPRQWLRVKAARTAINHSCFTNEKTNQVNQIKPVSQAFKHQAPGGLAARQDSNTCTSITSGRRRRRREENQHAEGKVALQPHYTGVLLLLIMPVSQPLLLEWILKAVCEQPSLQSSFSCFWTLIPDAATVRKTFFPALLLAGFRLIDRCSEPWSMNEPWCSSSSSSTFLFSSSSTTRQQPIIEI